MEIGELLTAISGIILGGGGILAYQKTKVEIPKLHTESQDIIIKNLREENERLYRRVEELELRLEKE